MISEASDRLQMAQEACLDGDILTSFEGFCTTVEHSQHEPVSLCFASGPHVCSSQCPRLSSHVTDTCLRAIMFARNGGCGG